MRARGNEGVAGRVKITDGAIGYMEYGYAQQRRVGYGGAGEQSRQFHRALATAGQATLATTQGDMPANLRMFFPDPPGEDSYPFVTYSWILLYGSTRIRRRPRP